MTDLPGVTVFSCPGCDPIMGFVIWLLLSAFLQPRGKEDLNVNIQRGAKEQKKPKCICIVVYFSLLLYLTEREGENRYSSKRMLKGRDRLKGNNSFS